MAKGGFRNEAFQKNGKRGGGVQHEGFDDKKGGGVEDLAGRFRVEKRDIKGDPSPLERGSLKGDTIHFLEEAQNLTAWTPELENALEREGFSKDSHGGEGNHRTYSYLTSAGSVKEFKFTPEEAFKILRQALKKEEGDKVLTDVIKNGMEAVKKERSVTDVASIPLGHGKLARESIQYIHSMLLVKNPPITKDLLTILRDAGYSAYLIRMKSGDKEIPKKVKVSLANDKSHVWELTPNETIDLLRRHIEDQEKTLSVEKNELEITANPDKLPEVDITEAKNPFSISGDLEKSDQGDDADKLDINNYRRIQDEEERRRRADADFIAEQERNVEKARLFSLSEQKKLEREREDRVVAAETFEELEDAIREIGDIQGSKKVYPAENEILRIKAFGERYVTAPMEVYEKVLNLFTNTYHLRDKIDQLVKKEREMIGEKIRQEAEEDVVVRGFDKEAFEFPERYDAVWDRFVATHPEKAVLYREHNPGIRSALERKEGNVSIPKVEPKPEKQKFFDMRFETEFGITEEQLSEMEGFEQLSEGQQKLVLENLREYARDTRGGFLSRTWEGVLKKTTGHSEGGEKYKHIVAELIKNTAQFGPKVHEENGELLTDFIDVGIPQQFRKEHKPIFDRFNALAHQYAKMKVEDLEDGIGTHSKDESKFVSFFKNTFSESRRKHDAYESLQESYESVKRALAKSFAEMGKSEGEIAEKLVQIDSKVHSLRFLQTESEAVEVIKQNPDKSFWQKVGEKIFSKENMAYAGLGFVGRMALTGAMGLYAAPVVASAVGGIRSWNKASAELREKDRMARGGMRDTSGEALNIIDATREVEIGGRKKDSGVSQKLHDLIEKYKEFAHEGKNTEERNSVIESMRARVQYIEDKIKLNRINFGSGTERATNMANLFEALGEARVLLADAEMPKGSALEARLEQFLVKREGLIQTRRRKKQIKTAAWGTLKAGAFALAGRELAEYIQESDFFSKEGGVTGVAASGSASYVDETKISSQAQVGYGSDANQVAESSKSGSVVQESRVRGVVPESTPEIQKSVPYTIQAGDTLTKILKEQVPSIKDLGHTHAQENAVANILRSLTLDEMDSIGVRSHNIDDIKVDDSIEVEKLNAIIAEKQSIIESAQKRFGDEPVRSYAEASPRIGGQQIEISKDIEALGASPKADEVVTTDQGREASSSEEKSASGITLEQQAEDSSLRSEEEAPRAEAQQKSPTPNEPAIQPASPSEKIIEIEDAPVERIEANDHVPSKFPEEGVRIPKDIEVVDVSVDRQVEGSSIESSVRVPESTIPDYSEDGGTILDAGTPEAKIIPNTLSSQEIFTNTHGVEVDLKKEHIYELTGQGGEKVMVSYGGKDFGTRFDTAQEYVQKNPEAVVVVEEEPRYGAFGQKLPPSYVEVRNIRGEGVTTIFSIQDDTLPASSEKGIDPATFTKKVTK